jgi:hypothetical protein
MEQLDRVRRKSIGERRRLVGGGAGSEFDECPDQKRARGSVDRFARDPYTPAPMNRTLAFPGPVAPRARLTRFVARPAVFGGLVAVLALVTPHPTALAAQEIGYGEGVRFGITAGGISTIGFAVEFFENHHSLDITVGTWSFRDLSVSVVGKEYFGAGALHPYVGGGLWIVAAAPRDERPGFAAVLRAPVGVDWRVAGRHSLGLAINVNRALGVRRTDPEDNLPLNKRLVPLPGVYYRWTR